MFEVIGAGPLVGPWLGIWDLVLDSPGSGMALAAVLVTTAMAGIALAVFGGSRPQAPVQTVAIVVQAPRPSRRMRRRR
jgi:hypothetical protein